MLHDEKTVGHGLIQIDHLTVRYGALVALRDITLQLAQHKITAIVGPSGSGKSTLLAAVNRLTDLIPGAHVSGNVRINGTSIYDSHVPVTDIRRRIGMVFQRPNPFPMSIRRNITLALGEIGLRQRSRLDAIVQQVLTDVALWQEVKDRLEYPAHKLSGGQQQRLCIARALALKPDVLLMDEPCSALDPTSAAIIEELMLRLRERYTIVLVTHNLAQARRVADYTAVLWPLDGEGRLIEFGSTEELFAQPKHPLTRAYLTGQSG